MLGIVVFVCTPPRPLPEGRGGGLCVCLFALSAPTVSPLPSGEGPGMGFICLCVRGLRSAACGGWVQGFRRVCGRFGFCSDLGFKLRLAMRVSVVVPSYWA